MPEEQDALLTIGISSRTLFDLDHSHQIYETRGLEAYREYQIAHEDEPLQPGEAFHLVQKLLALNQEQRQWVEILLLSRNSADTGLRVFNSIEHYGLQIERAAFCGGRNPHGYAEAFNCDLFLSNNARDVRSVLERGQAAAHLLGSHRGSGKDAEHGRDDEVPVVPSLSSPGSGGEIRFAFDGDAVLFDDEPEKVYQKHGMKEFARTEKEAASQPLQGGPFGPFLHTLHQLQSRFPGNSRIRTALVTARSAPAHERVIRTLREWKIRIDEALFLGGKPKGPFLQAYGADIFFDDQQGHCDSAQEFDVVTGHVPSGVNNPRARRVETPETVAAQAEPQVSKRSPKVKRMAASKGRSTSSGSRVLSRLPK